MEGQLRGKPWSFHVPRPEDGRWRLWVSLRLPLSLRMWERERGPEEACFRKLLPSSVQGLRPGLCRGVISGIFLPEALY